MNFYKITIAFHMLLYHICQQIFYIKQLYHYKQMFVNGDTTKILIEGDCMAIYSFRHLFIIFTFLIMPILWAFTLKGNNKILHFSIITLFLLEIFRIIFLIITGNFRINSDLSFQLCFTYSFIGIVYLITKKEFILNYLGPFGILFSLAAIIFTDPNPFLSFTVIDCYLYHTFLLFMGTYITKNYKPKFSYKSIIIFWFQIILAYFANTIIKHGSNYVFLNTFLKPSYNLNYTANIEAFNIPFLNGSSINDILIFLIQHLGHFYYNLLLIIIITIIITVWLHVFSNKNELTII